jgi:hypothetical protein
MLRRLLLVASLALATLVVPVHVATAQTAATVTPGAFHVNDRVEVEYVPNSGKWLPATVVDVQNDGFAYKVRVAPWGNGATTETSIHFKRVRAASAASATPVPATPETPPSRGAVHLASGRYGCTSSQFSSSAHAIEYTPRGSIELAADGTYRYLGLQTPSAGKYQRDASGKLAFSGGYLNGGEATPIEGETNRFQIVTATLPGGRWTCGRK